VAEAKTGIKGNELTDNPALDTEREAILFDQGSNKGYRYSHSPNFPKIKINEFTDQTTPTEPDVGKTKLYSKGDGMYYRKNGAAETKLLDFATDITSKFHTNLSPSDIREDTEDFELDTVSTKSEQIGFGFKTGYESVDPTSFRLKNVQQAVVPAVSHELSYIGAGWSNVIDANTLYRERSITSTAGDYVELGFSGTSITLLTVGSTSGGQYKAEISRDGGLSWFDEQILTNDTTSATVWTLEKVLWENIISDDYLIRVTNITGTTFIEGFSYTVHANPYPITNYYSNTDAKTIDDVPFGHWLMTGSMTLNTFSADMWNCRFASTASSPDTYEIKFYGNKIWLMSQWANSYTAVYNVTIDGVTTSVKQNSFNTDTGDGATLPNLHGMIRIDDGTLSDGVHTLKITMSGAGSATPLGAFVSSDLADSSHCFGLRVGKQEVIPVDDPRWAYSGNWTLFDNTSSAFRRLLSTSTLSDYATCDISGFSNIKSISLIHAENSDRTRATCDLGSSVETRYYSDYGSALFNCHSRTLYDYTVDDLSSSSTIRFALHTAGTTDVQALVVEYFDENATDGTGATGLNSINIMPKMSRYNNSNNANGWKSAVSNTYRLEIEGEKTDDSQPRENWCNTGWLYSNSTTARFNTGVPNKAGLNLELIQASLPSSKLNYTNVGISTGNSYIPNEVLPGVMSATTGWSVAVWAKIKYKLDYVL
jgi:hypothetical protein